jgi:hypothetical protein
MASRSSQTTRTARRLFVPPENPTTSLASPEIAARRDRDGLTWSQRESELRAALSATLSGQALEDEIRKRFRHFVMFELTNPAADRRQRLFDEAYAATPPSGRKRLVEIALDNLT